MATTDGQWTASVPQCADEYRHLGSRLRWPVAKNRNRPWAGPYHFIEVIPDGYGGHLSYQTSVYRKVTQHWVFDEEITRGRREMHGGAMRRGPAPQRE